MKNLNQFSDSELYTICKKWGHEALYARRKFAGLLPEVYRREMKSRGLFPKSWLEKRGYTCIYEFAARLAGMSRDQVNRVLQLDKRFTGMPILKEALIDGDVSVNKLARIASVATFDNQREILNKAEKLSKAALEVYVKEHIKEKCGADLESEDGDYSVSLFEPDVSKKPSLAVPGHRFGDTEIKNHYLQLDTDVETELSELQNKGIDINVFLRKCLEQRKLEIAQEKEKLAQEANRDRWEKFIIGKPASRYVPAKIKRIIRAQYGHACSAERCTKPAAHIHHEKPFTTFGSHDPRHLRPLCKAHHELEHAGSG